MCCCLSSSGMNSGMAELYTLRHLVDCTEKDLRAFESSEDG